jgi:preprotein translocase subunit SecE
MNSILTFLKQTRAEMRNVIWPSRSTAVTYAVVVIVLSLAIGFVLGGFDSLFASALRVVLG